MYNSQSFLGLFGWGNGQKALAAVSAFFFVAARALPAIIAAEGNHFMPVRTTLLTLAALALFDCFTWTSAKVRNIPKVDLALRIRTDCKAD